MPVCYQLLCLDALAQPIAIDHALRFIKKRKILLKVQFIGLLASMLGRG